MKITTLTEYILREEQAAPGATGHLTLLLNQIAEAGKIIASHVKKTGLVDLIGATGQKNAFDEEVQRLDEFANDIFIDILSSSDQVTHIASEELGQIHSVKDTHGEYTVFLDPLDGSSNIETNATIGTIFSIYHKSADELLPGNKQVASGYISYGPNVMFVYSCSPAVNGFTLDPAIGSFLLSHPDIKVPHQKNEYSINEAYEELFDASLQNYLADLKKSKSYRLRYIGTMVADVHRTLFKGGIFLYPADVKNPQGKLRLMFEVNPLSLLMIRAGGLAISNGKNPLEITPSQLNERVPIVMGSKGEVEKYLSYVK